MVEPRVVELPFAKLVLVELVVRKLVVVGRNRAVVGYNRVVVGCNQVVVGCNQVVVGHTASVVADRNQRLSFQDSKLGEEADL